VADRATANGKPLLNDLIRWGTVAAGVLAAGAPGASVNVADADGWTAVIRPRRAATSGCCARAGCGRGYDAKGQAGQVPRDLTRKDKIAEMLKR